eukprot:scaffold125791_cov14-Prasinocladus_malaysianus.AAC.1
MVEPTRPQKDKPRRAENGGAYFQIWPGQCVEHEYSYSYGFQAINRNISENAILVVATRMQIIWRAENWPPLRSGDFRFVFVHRRSAQGNTSATK